MLFSSPIFLFVFLPIVLILVAVAKHSLTNALLLLASLIFYSWGNVDHLVLFILSILFNYGMGLAINGGGEAKSKLYLTIGVMVNLGALMYFKYFNFFTDNLNELLSGLGKSPIEYKQVALPIGISFFTFHNLSYIIDVYRRRVTAQRNLLDLALYISFFPQLIAGPIVRYIDVAEQFKTRTVTLLKVSEGAQRFIFGLAKKILIANTMAFVADRIFALNPSDLSFGLSWLGIIAYTLQIYFDFSGYSDMALGLARIFGFTFPENFNYPYKSQSIKEFWRRWHISLSTWFRDFLYIPLGGSHGSQAKTIRNLMIVFFATGFWHGASWTFVIWGLYHGLFLLLERIGFDQVLESTWRPVRVLYTLLVVMVGWVFFRADTLSLAIDYLGTMFSFGVGVNAKYAIGEFVNIKILMLLVVATVYSFGWFRTTIIFIRSTFESSGRVESYPTFLAFNKASISLVLLALSLFSLASGTYNPFIYFRF